MRYTKGGRNELDLTIFYAQGKEIKLDFVNTSGMHVPWASDLGYHEIQGVLIQS